MIMLEDLAVCLDKLTIFEDLSLVIGTWKLNACDMLKLRARRVMYCHNKAAGARHLKAYWHTASLGVRKILYAARAHISSEARPSQL